MGRYFSGDIEGKFWFAVQSSDAADRFGVVGKPEELYYYFDESNLEEVQEEIEQIIKDLGDNYEKIKEFFNTNVAYTDQKLAEYLGVKEVELMLSQYADLELGIKIRDCIKENGSCSFTAEL